MNSKRKNSIRGREILIGIGLIFLGAGFLLSWHSDGSQAASVQTVEKVFGLHMAQDLAVDPEGNVYVTGYGYTETNDYDFVTIKYDAEGRLIWTERYNGPANSSDYAQALALDENGNVYVAGHSNGPGTSLDATLIKYDTGGEKLWVARFDGAFHRDDWVYDLAIDGKDHIIVTGYSFGEGTEHDWLILKYGADGGLLWKAIYNSPLNRDDMCQAIALGSGGDIFLTGIDRTGETSYDMTTIAYDAGGALNWTARFAGPGGAFDAGEAVGVDNSGNVYVTGYGYTMDTEDDLIAASYDRDGKERWTIRFDGPSNRIDRGLSLAVIPKNGVCVTGLSYGLESGSDSLTIHFDSDGKEVWTARYSGEGSGADLTHSITLDPESNLVVSGCSRGQETGRDYLIIKYDLQGRQIWAKTYDGPAHREDTSSAMTVDGEGNVYVTGWSQTQDSDFEFASLKFAPSGELLWSARYHGE